MKNVIKFMVLVLVGTSFAFTELNKKIIVIDAGHGGMDNGAKVEGVVEKDINLALAKKIIELNTNPQVEIILTRTSDQFVSLDERARIINEANADYVISLHTNSSNNKHKSGTEIYYSLNNDHSEKSKNLATELANVITHGEVSIKNGDFYLLKNSKSPILLVELGYLSNSVDKTMLSDDTNQAALAQSILKLF